MPTASTLPDESAPVIPLPQARREQPRRRRGIPDTDPCPDEPWDDLGAGKRFATLYRDRVRNVSTRREWMIWDGRRWTVDERREVDRWAEAVARKMLVWAAKVPDSAERKKALKAAEYACQTGGKAAMLAMASHADWIATGPNEFDRSPELLGCRNGVVNLATGELRAHDPAHMLTMSTGVDYVPGATHPDWTAVLTAMRPDCVTWVQTRVGQAATGWQPDDDAMLFMRGTGENGKSTFISGLANALGDYARLISERALLADPKAHPVELMEFRGCRLAFTEELPEGGRLNAARLKKIIGTPRMTARAIRGNPEVWEATHSWFLGTNHLPMVDDTDWGTWRRMLLLDFPYKYLKAHEVPGSEFERVGDPALKHRVKNPLVRQAALAWVVAGARAWFREGCIMPAPPASVLRDTDSWRGGSDLILGYWADRLQPDPGSMVWQKELYTDFSEWLNERGHPAWSNRLFVDRFRDHDQTRKARLVGKKAKPTGGRALSRPRLSMASLPTAIDAWIGVRFVDPNEVDLGE